MSSNLDAASAGPRAIIFGCAGPQLTDRERRFFREADPAGFIVFRRNVNSPEQLRGLVCDLRECVGRADAPILIDQEGGRVARLGPPHWPALPAARRIGVLAEQDEPAGLAAAKAVGRIIGAMLAELGIDVACAPVADLLLPQTDAVIGDRAYGADPGLVGRLASAMADGLADCGVTAIVKHLPGHGRATADSHLELPRIDAPLDLLRRTDFAAFRAVRTAPPANPWGMIAHCVYSAVDPDRPASISATVISRIIRGEVGFEGLLIADDIGMKALRAPLAYSAAATLAAGCDLTLHCSGDFEEMEQVAPGVRRVSPATQRRLAHAVPGMAEGVDLRAEWALLERLGPG